MKQNVLIIGSSDGIGLGVAKRLLTEGWSVIGISRSGSKIDHSDYRHHVCDVMDGKYIGVLKKVIKDGGVPDLCLYCPGIGEQLDLDDMEADIKTLDINLMGMVRTVSVVVPDMEEKGCGHFIGLSSFADAMHSYDSPAYHASKAGFSMYLESMALALQDTPVKFTNVRFGFVNTKMAKGDVKPFMMSVDKAVGHIVKCIRKKPARYSAPKVAIPFIRLRRKMLNIKILLK